MTKNEILAVCQRVLAKRPDCSVSDGRVYCRLNVKPLSYYEIASLFEDSNGSTGSAFRYLMNQKFKAEISGVKEEVSCQIFSRIPAEDFETAKEVVEGVVSQMRFDFSRVLGQKVNIDEMLTNFGGNSTWERMCYDALYDAFLPYVEEVTLGEMIEAIDACVERYCVA